MNHQHEFRSLCILTRRQLKAKVGHTVYPTFSQLESLNSSFTSLSNHPSPEFGHQAFNFEDAQFEPEELHCSAHLFFIFNVNRSLCGTFVGSCSRMLRLKTNLFSDTLPTYGMTIFLHLFFSSPFDARVVFSDFSAELWKRLGSGLKCPFKLFLFLFFALCRVGIFSAQQCGVQMTPSFVPVGDACQRVLTTFQFFNMQQRGSAQIFLYYLFIYILHIHPLKSRSVFIHFLGLHSFDAHLHGVRREHHPLI